MGVWVNLIVQMMVQSVSVRKSIKAYSSRKNHAIFKRRNMRYQLGIFICSGISTVFVFEKSASTLI